MDKSKIWIKKGEIDQIKKKSKKNRKKHQKSEKTAEEN